MKERPIIFSGPMVRAILEGRKTMTRRVLKRAHDTIGKDTAWAVCPASDSGWIAWFGLLGRNIEEFTKKSYAHGFPCPYGAVGDLLWVREKWQAIHVDSDEGDYHASYDIPPAATEYWKIIYAASDPQADYHKDDRGFSWRPSIHMPRWASRLTLEITGVKVERLQDIGEQDAISEGTREPSIRSMSNALAQAAWSERQVFQRLWNHININRESFSWSDNPWVWVVEFRSIL